MAFVPDIHISVAIAFIGITLLSAIVHGALGIGFPLIATPLIAMLTDVRTAILLLVLPTAAINIVNILKGGHWERSLARYWPLAVYGAAGSFIGTRILIAVPAEVFRPLLAAMLILYLNAERLGAGFGWIPRKPRFSMAVFGLTGGLLAGTVNVMLPALIIFALEMRLPKTVTIQVFNFCFFFGKVTQGAVFIHAGLFDADILRISIPIAVLGLATLAAGLRLRDHIPTATYRRWMRRLLVLLAVILLVQTWLNL